MKPIFIEYCMMVLTIINVFWITKKYSSKKWYTKIGIVLLLIIVSIIMEAIVGSVDMFLPMGQYIHFTISIMSYVIVNAVYYIMTYNGYFANYERVFLEMNNGNEGALSDQRKKKAQIKKRAILISVATSVICLTLPLILVVMNSSRKGIEFLAVNNITKIPSNMVYKGNVVRFKGVDIYEHKDQDGYTYVALIKTDLKNLSDMEINWFSDMKDWDYGFYFKDESGGYIQEFKPCGNFVINYTYYKAYMTPAMSSALNSIDVMYSFDADLDSNETGARYLYKATLSHSDYKIGDPPGDVMDAMLSCLYSMQ